LSKNKNKWELAVASTWWLFFYFIQIEMEFGDVGEGKARVPGEIPLGTTERLK